MQKHIIEAITENGYWISGLIDDNPFNMRVEDELPDVIKFERIDTAFLIDRSNHDELIGIERHHFQGPSTPEQVSMLSALSRFAASLPKQEVWGQSFKKMRIFVVDEESVLEATAYDHS